MGGKFTNVVRCGGSGLAKHDRGRDLFADARLWHREDYSLHHIRVFQEDFFDFVWRDLDAAPIDELLGAPLNEYIAFPINQSDIAGAEPPTCEALLIGGRIAEVGRDH